MALIHRPKGPVSANVSAITAYLTALEKYTTALEVGCRERLQTMSDDTDYWRIQAADVLTQLHEAERENAQLRAALAGLVGAESVEELQAMEAVMRVLPAPAADKAAMLDAIHALLGATKGDTR